MSHPGDPEWEPDEVTQMDQKLDDILKVIKAQLGVQEEPQLPQTTTPGTPTPRRPRPSLDSPVVSRKV